MIQVSEIRICNDKTMIYRFDFNPHQLDFYKVNCSVNQEAYARRANVAVDLIMGSETMTCSRLCVIAIALRYQEGLAPIG